MPLSYVENSNYHISKRSDYAPSHRQQKEEQTQHNVANVGEDIVESCEDTIWARAFKIVKTNILIARFAKRLKKCSNKTQTHGDSSSSL